MSTDDLAERELMWNRFRRLITEVLREETKRTVFQPWEVELLIDINSCVLPPRRRAAALRYYLTTVERQLEHGPGPPMKFSEFLQRRTTLRPSK